MWKKIVSVCSEEYVILSTTSEDRQVDNDNAGWLRGLLKWWGFWELFNIKGIL